MKDAVIQTYIYITITINIVIIIKFQTPFSGAPVALR